jgi:hypothetical protein
MGVGNIAGDLALSMTASTINVSVLKSVENLQQDVVARLFGSMGIGNSVDAYA